MGKSVTLLGFKAISQTGRLVISMTTVSHFGFAAMARWIASGVASFSGSHVVANGTPAARAMTGGIPDSVSWTWIGRRPIVARPAARMTLEAVRPAPPFEPWRMNVVMNESFCTQGFIGGQKTIVKRNET
jgi:hypothetical protein